MTRKRMREQRREELILATMRCIVSKGYNYVTIEDICKEVGMSRGIVSYHFKNKEELLVSVLEKMIDDSTEVIKSFVGLSGETIDDHQLYQALGGFINQQNPEKIIRDGIMTINKYIQDHQNNVLVFLEFLSQANRNKAIGDLISYLNRRFWDIGEMIITEGVRQNIFKETDPRLTVQLLVAGGIGILLNAATDKNFFPIENHIEELTNLALRYLAPA